MNYKQKIFTMIYLLIIGGITGGIVYLIWGENGVYILLLVEGVTLAILGATLGVVFLFAWIYGWLEK